MEDFSLIILCQGKKRHLLSSTLDTLKAQKGSFEVIIIEEGDLSQASMLAPRYPELKMRIERVDGGIGKMMNRGVKKAAGTYVQFLEPGDRYISQHGLSFLSELIEQRPFLISGRPELAESRFFWLQRDKVLESGGFNEKLRFCPMQDLLCRFEAKGLQPLVCPRVFVDSPYEPSFSFWEHGKVLYHHFGLKRALNWFFVQNRPLIVQRAARFIKQSFWQNE